MPEFAYQEPLPLGTDSTRYRLRTPEYVSVVRFDGQEVLKVDPEALTMLARDAFRIVAFFYRTSHLAKVAAILDDPDSSPND
jgi:fumarate hydratase, class I